MSRACAAAMIANEMAAYKTARTSGEIDVAWRHLERAHIVSQPYLGLHLTNHREMLGFAVELRDWREVAGQLVRLVLAPLGALTGRIPTGNTGRSNVSAFQPMPLPADLEVLLQDEGVR
ncbi:MAG: DUF3703 domain-containing protein [Sphingopyxis sp.]|jgi:hypothetical protein|nr:DUF3703 domain-containing protein [Sphingopyxis sp.]